MPLQVPTGFLRYWPLLTLLVVLAVMLGGCNEADDLRPNDKSAICKALIGPIKYTTQTKTSQRYAGVVLGLDLKQRNQIGVGLNCPQYR